MSSEGAEWIRPNDMLTLNKWNTNPWQVAYRTVFAGDSRQEAVLTIRARKSVILFLDNIEVSRASDAWEKPMSFDMGPHLTPGRHELKILAENSSGLPMVMAYSAALGIRTGKDWETSSDFAKWSPAVLANGPRVITGSMEFERADRIFLSNLPVLIPIFISVFAWTVLCCRESNGSLTNSLAPSPRALSLAVMAALAVLAANNFWSMETDVGFDQLEHLDYIKYVAENLSVPLAHEGWEMMQAPFYYIISAPAYIVFKGHVTEETLIRVLRLIPAFFSILLVEAIFRAARHAFPDRREQQSIAVVLGGLLPMNIYLSRGLGNELAATFFSSAAIAVGLGLLRAPSGSAVLRKMLLMGSLFGFALLSKVSAILIAPFIAGICLYRFLAIETDLENRSKRALSCLAASFGAAFIIAGWYYIRNLVNTGRFFVGNWDPAVWWQDPSYRMPSDLYSFGNALYYPAYSTMGSFWDGFYSTLWTDANFSGMIMTRYLAHLWNSGLMLSTVWLAVIPSLGIITGIVISLAGYRGALRNGILILSMTLALFVGALMDFYLTVPFFTTSKASYTSSITVGYALIGAAGLGAMARGRFLRGAVYGCMACWAVFAYGAYFIL